MAETGVERIASTLMAEPHIAGRRISVLHVTDWVEGRGMRPKQVAHRFDLDVVDVYAALAYYHDHPTEVSSLREERQRSVERATRRAEADRPPGVEPP